MAARIEKLPATGEIALTGLPTTGRLRLLLIQRDAPQSTAESTTLGFNTLPVLMDTSRPPGPSSVHPQGWQLLCEPCALTTTMADQPRACLGTPVAGGAGPAAAG